MKNKMHLCTKIVGIYETRVTLLPLQEPKPTKKKKEKGKEKKKKVKSEKRKTTNSGHP